MNNSTENKDNALILRLDVSGRPVRWIPWQRAVILQCRERVAWTAGEKHFTFYGGKSRLTGEQSTVSINTIVAIKGYLRNVNLDAITPPLSNRELFRRDRQLCLYCGFEFPEQKLTRDHIIPLSLGGLDTWNNTVTACKNCNHAKGARTPEQASMPLIAIPYVPNRAEYLVLSNRRILADQMDFLRRRFRRDSRLIDRRTKRIEL